MTDCCDRNSMNFWSDMFTTMVGEPIQCVCEVCKGEAEDEREEEEVGK